MNSKKLVWCCILGIVLGYLAPFVLDVTRGTSLSVGMVAGLGFGYLLDALDEKKSGQEETAVLSKKARDANQLMAQARAEVSGKPFPAADADDDLAVETDFSEAESNLEIEAEKLSSAEEMLKKARERISK